MENLPEAEQRLGNVRARHLAPVHGTVFPNMSFLFGTGTIRVWHPRGPEKTEIWAYAFIDKDAPESVKRDRRIQYMQRFGPSGTWEEDDMDNWKQSTTAGKGYLGKRMPVHVEMGLGHEGFHEDLPGRTSPLFSEINQRALYSRWQEMMSADSWQDISLTPKTTT
jgi:hypothetical protein